MTTTTGQNTLAKIGNFMGQRVRELLNLISTKADRAELEKLPRFFEASSSSEMLTLDGVRQGDFCLRLDTQSGFRLRRLPAAYAASWDQVFAAAAASVTKTVSFAADLDPLIKHDMGKIPSLISIVDETGRVQIADWEAVDFNHIRLHFTELTAGKCSMTFQP